MTSTQVGTFSLEAAQVNEIEVRKCDTITDEETTFFHNAACHLKINFTGYWALLARFLSYELVKMLLTHYI